MQRVDAYGCVDELNTALGLARAATSNEFVRSEILAVQKELIVGDGRTRDVTAKIWSAIVKDGFQITTGAMVDRLTAVIDELEKDKSLYPKDWAIPGDSRWLRPRLIWRERPAAAPNAASLPLVNDDQAFNIEILRYLNRLVGSVLVAGPIDRAGGLK